MIVLDCNTGTSGVGEIIGVGVMGARSGRSVGVLEVNNPPRSGKLQEVIPNANRARDPITTISLKNDFF